MQKGDITKRCVLDAERRFYADESWAKHDIDALDALFTACPKNTSPWQVLLKVTALNALYKTRIMNIYPVVETILGVGCKLDALIARADPSAVDLMKMVKFAKREKVMNFFSFASKFCHFHRPDRYPIYDQYVDAALRRLRKDKMLEFETASLNREVYAQFKSVVDMFIERYADGCSYDAVDKYLWRFGKSLKNGNVYEAGMNVRVKKSRSNDGA